MVLFIDLKVRRFSVFHLVDFVVYEAYGSIEVKRGQKTRFQDSFWKFSLLPVLPRSTET